MRGWPTSAHSSHHVVTHPPCDLKINGYRERGLASPKQTCYIISVPTPHHTPDPSPKQTTMQIPLHIRPKKAVKTFPNPFRRHSINLARRSIKFNQPLIKFNHSSINLDQSQSTFNRIQSDSAPGPGIHPRTHPSLTPWRPLFSLTFPPLFGTFWPM